MVKMFRRDSNDAISLVLYYVDEEYREVHPNLLTTMENRKITWVKALRIAEENGLLYHFSKKLLEDGGELPNELLKNILRQEEENLVKLKKTLHFVSSLFREEDLDFIFIKLYRGKPYVPRDVDVLVKRAQNQRIVSELKKRNVTVRTFYGVETQFEKEDLLDVDLYQGFYYLSLPFLEAEFLWRDTRTVNICGVECPIPGNDADFLSLLIHALLGHRYLSLLDFLYSKSLLLNGSLNIDELVYHTKQLGWSDAFMTMVTTVQSIHRELYLNLNSRPIDFPYIFSPKFIWKAFRGFEDVPISTKTKFAFTLSTLIDAAFNEYQTIQRSVSFEMPKGIEDFIMKWIYRIRGWCGDRKAMCC